MLGVLAALCLLACPAQASAAPTRERGIEWQPCNERFQCATVQVPLDYDQPRGGKISICARPPARDRSGAPDRLAVPQPWRARRLWRRLRCRSPARPCTRMRCAPASTSSASTRAASCAAPRCAASARPRQWEPYFTPFAFPMTPRGGAGVDRGRPLPGRRVRPARRAASSTTCRPPTSRATSTCCAPRSATSS